jgi:hypothetical protein
MENAEHGRGGADPEAEGGDGHRREGGSFSESPEGESSVLGQIVHPPSPPGIPDLLLGPLNAPEIPLGLALGFVRSHPRLDVRLGFLLQVVLELLRQLALRPILLEEYLQAPPQFPQPVHLLFLPGARCAGCHTRNPVLRTLRSIPGFAPRHRRRA